jgi:hypothetical protein
MSKAEIIIALAIWVFLILAPFLVALVAVLRG